MASTCFVFPRVTLDCGSPLRACVWVWDVIRECVCVEPESLTSAEYCNAAERTTTHTTAMLNQPLFLQPSILFFHSPHVTLSFLPHICHPLLSHFSSSHWSVQLYWPTLPQRARAQETLTHIFMHLWLTQREHIYSTVTAALHQNPFIIQMLEYSSLMFLHAEMDKLAKGGLLL